MGTSLKDVIEGAEKLFGSKSVMRLTDKKAMKVAARSTGIPQLDIALGVGGFPKGRIIEIYGPESSGKTTLTANFIATNQKEGDWVWYGDMEHAIDPEWFEKIGVDLDKLIISQPNNGEECLNIAEYMINSGVIDIAVVDSVSALVPKAELAGESGESHMGLQARMMSQAMRKLVPIVSNKGATMIFINQIREKIGQQWGSPETTSGGRALKFASSVRLDIRRTGSTKDGEDFTGNSVKIKVVKNKVAPPFKICEADIGFEHGFDLCANLLIAGLARDIFTKKGSWFDHEGTRMGQGAIQAAEYIRNMDIDKQKELYKEVLKRRKVDKETGEITTEEETEPKQIGEATVTV